MTPSPTRVAHRYLIALRIDQRRGEYPTKFWREVTLRLCKTMGVKHGKLQVLFRKGVGKRDDSAMGLCRGANVVEIDPNWSLRTQMRVLAHELRHAYQHQSGMLHCGKSDGGEYGNIWKGKWYSDELPWEARPWEIDAQKFDRVGQKLHDQMKAKGEIALSKQQEFKQKQPFGGPTMGDMDDVLSEDEFVAEVKERKLDKDAWREKWRLRYLEGWRGLKATPEVGDVRTRVATRPVPIDKSQVQRAAKQVMSLLPRVLGRLPADEPLWKSGKLGPYFVDDIETTDMRGLPVLVSLWVTAKRGSNMAFWLGGSVGWDKGEKVQLNLKLNASMTPSELLSGAQSERELYSILLHEFTHLQDTYNPHTDLAHDDRPHEVRAYMQQVADEVVSYLLSGAKGAGARWFWMWRRKDKGRVSQKLMHEALQHSRAWNDHADDLLPKNRKLLLRGVATAVADAEPLFAEAESNALARVR